MDGATHVHASHKNKICHTLPQLWTKGNPYLQNVIVTGAGERADGPCLALINRQRNIHRMTAMIWRLLLAREVRRHGSHQRNGHARRIWYVAGSMA